MAPFRLPRIFFPLLLLAVAGCGSQSAESGNEVVYICNETKQLVTAELQPVPAVNPTTGRPTLLRALYCEKCRKWHAVPPPEVFPDHPAKYPCPKHGMPMSETGPMDQKATGRRP
jgi:hypothetical protein